MAVKSRNRAMPGAQQPNRFKPFISVRSVQAEMLTTWKAGALGWVFLLPFGAMHSLLSNRSTNVYEDCGVPSSIRVFSIRQKAVGNLDENQATLYWMCFGDFHNPSHGKLNSDGTGGLANKTIVAAYRLDDPYVVLQNDKNGQTETRLTGYLVDFWRRVQRRLKFQTKFLEMSFEEAKNRLAMSDVDILLMPMVQTIERSNNFGFTLPVSSHWYTLFLRRTRVAVAPDAHVRAVSYSMIMPMIIALILIFFSLWCSELIGARLLKDQEDYRFDALQRQRSVQQNRKLLSWRQFIKCLTLVSAGECFMSTLCHICSQDWHGVTKRLPTRIVLMSSFIFGYLVMNAYSAVLISYLAAGSRNVPYGASLEDIAKHGDYVVCVRKDSFAYSSFTTSPGGPIKPFWRNMVNVRPCPSKPKTTEQLLRALCKEEGSVWERYLDVDPRVGVLEIPGVMAAALEKPLAVQYPYQPEVRHCDKCRIVRMHRRHVVNMASLMLRRGFPHTRELNIEILRIRAAGLVDRLEFKWMGRNRLDHHAPLWDKTIYKPVLTTQISLLHVRTILHIFTTSLMIPWLILLCEIISWNSPWQRLLSPESHPVMKEKKHNRNVIRKGDYQSTITRTSVYDPDCKKEYFPSVFQRREGRNNFPARVIITNLTVPHTSIHINESASY